MRFELRAFLQSQKWLSGFPATPAKGSIGEAGCVGCTAPIYNDNVDRSWLSGD
jgi:hypothetical protein